MKFEFSIDVKGIPTAQAHVSFECTNDELVTLISDPVYQELGRKLIREVNFAPKTQPKQEVDTNVVTEELCERVNSLLKSFRKDMEADKKARDVQLNIMNRAADRACKAAERTQKF